MSVFVQEWARGEPLRDWDRLNERLGELEFILREFQSRLGAGPVPGAYFPLQIPIGIGEVGTGVWRLLLPVEARPVMVSVGVVAGEVSIDLKDDGTSILSAPLLTSAGIALARSRSQFGTEKIVGGSILTLDINSNSGTARGSVLLVLKALGKIEQI